MSTIVEKLAENKYVHLPDFLDQDNCTQLTKELHLLVESNQTTKDTQCPKSEAIYGAAVFDKLLEDLLPYFETATGKKLLPTYSYARLYKQGEKLKVHVDRPSCEISATITLGLEGGSWSIFMGNKDKSESAEIKMGVGDAVLYQGTKVHHWRKRFKGTWQAQVFLHYVDADGPHKHHVFDKRESLTKFKVTFQNMRHWIYTDILTPKACDLIIDAYDSVDKIAPVIGAGGGVVDTKVRNVERVILPTYKDIGGRLAAAGLDANQQAWKFDITHANQAEFLKYPTGGRYTAHVDMFLNPNEPCRKLTVLAFLNDDFKGGKFFLMDGHEKYYPPQAKGTIIVFPSFMLHGVEDIVEGTRYSVVCMMVGPFIK